MRLSRSSITIITCLTCLGFDPSPVSSTTYDQAPKVLKLVATTDTAIQFVLEPGSTGNKVQLLQNQLQKLGYYNGKVDGDYGRSTRLAVYQFQQAKGLVADGIVGTTTWNSLLSTLKQNQAQTLNLATSATPKSSTKQQQKRDFVWWLLLGMGIFGGFGALLYVIKSSRKVVPIATGENITSNQNGTNSVKPSQQLDTLNDEQSNSKRSQALVLPLETTSRLAKIDIVDELIADLRNIDLTKRRKAIWDLGQQGDSRAIQPLVDLIIDGDSQQRSLILAALSEISTRTLKPMNRALAISLQDESPQVRQNAIRDLTRVYDFMAQISQMLSHAVQDPDAEVQATAKYALSQMNRIRALPSEEKEKDTQTEQEA